MHRCQALLLRARVDQFYPNIIGCLPMASLRPLTRGVFGTLRWRIQAKTTTVIGMLKRAGAMSANDPPATSVVGFVALRLPSRFTL